MPREKSSFTTAPGRSSQSSAPFHWYLGGSPLTDGVQWSGVALLLGTTLVLVAAGTAAFTRRDLKA